MDIVIGDKSSIAAEICVANQESFVGHARIWVNNNFFGSLFELIYLDGYLAGGLMDILKKNNLNKKYSGMTHQELFNNLENDLCSDDCNNDIARSFCVNFGTITDIFSVYSYKKTNEIGVILWKIRDDLNVYDPYTLYEDLKGYPNKIFCEEFEYKELCRIIDGLYAVKTK